MPRDQHEEMHEIPAFSAPNELVTILVGPERTPFKIHKEAASSSPVLRAAFNSVFTEGRTQTYTLEDADVNAFQIVVQFMYSNAIRPLITPHEMNTIQGPVEDDVIEDVSYTVSDRTIHYLEAWNIADYLQLPNCQNRVVDQIANLAMDHDIIPACCLSLVYTDKFVETPIKDMVFELCRRYLDPVYYAPGSLELAKEIFPFEYLLEHVFLDKINPSGPNPVTDRAEFKRRYHVQEYI